MQSFCVLAICGQFMLRSKSLILRLTDLGRGGRGVSSTQQVHFLMGTTHSTSSSFLALDKHSHIPSNVTRYAEVFVEVHTLEPPLRRRQQKRYHAQNRGSSQCAKKKWTQKKMEQKEWQFQYYYNAKYHTAGSVERGLLVYSRKRRAVHTRRLLAFHLVHLVDFAVYFVLD